LRVPTSPEERRWTVDGASHSVRRNQERNVPVRREENPFAAFHRDMNRLFEELWRGFDLSSAFGEVWGSFSPRVDVDETDTEVRVTAELPGLEEKDVEVQLTDDALILKGERREEHEDQTLG